MLMNFSKSNNSIVISSVGAELKSFKSSNIEYIWESDAKYWKRSAPVLFPIVGTLKDKKTIINNQEYFIGQHGFLRDVEFEFIEHNDSICFRNLYSDETLKIYPFKYQADIIYQQEKNSLKTTFVITNLDNKEMPFNIGGHPAIKCPIFENEKFEDYKIIFEKEETFNSPKVMDNATLNFEEIVLSYQNLKTLELNKDLFKIDTIIIPKVKSNYVLLLNKENKGIKFSFENFKTLAFWTPYNNAPFICLEPWHGYNDRHNTLGLFTSKDELIKLAPLEKFQASYTISIIND